MTIREAWADGASRLAQASFTPQLDARLLLEFVLRREHSYLVAHGEESLDIQQKEQYERLLHRAELKEPIAYLLGKAPFYGLMFRVSSDVLIPRPETEQLVDKVLEWAGQHEVATIVDVGTGSGCIAISLARELPKANVTAVDISVGALAVARENGQRLAPGAIQFVQGDLLEGVVKPVDVIVANLPYVADSEWSMVDDGVKWYEPSLALGGGEDGLDLIRLLLQQAPAMLRSGGALFLEIGFQQGPAIERLARVYFPTAITTVFPDYAGHDRIVRVAV